MTTPLHVDGRDGVYFPPHDHAGFWRRVVCAAVDGAVLLAAWAGLFNVWVGMQPSPGFTGPTLLAAWLALAFLYTGPLKASPLRTLGYRAAGVTVIDLYGRRPSLPRMAVRSALYLIGTGFWLIDLVWTLGNAERRKLSDVIAGTYVVRAGAQPAGHGPVVPAIYCVLSYMIVYGEVRRPVQPERPRLA